MPDLNELMAGLLSGDEERAEAAVHGLIELGEPAIAPLLEAARSEDPDQRWWAVRAMGESPATRADTLLPFLQDDSVEVRQAAALGLAAHPSEAAIPELIRRLYDENAMAGSLAANALVKTGAACVLPLLEVMKQAPLPVQILAIRALAELKDHRAIPALLELAGADSAVLAYWAEEGLERLGLNMVYIKPT